MNLDELKQYLLSMVGAFECTPWGPENLVYKVGGKVFAVVVWDRSAMRISLKCSPDRVDELRAVFPAITPAPYFHKRHWNAVRLDGTIPDGEVEALVDDSYDLVVEGLTRAQRREIHGPGEG